MRNEIFVFIRPHWSPIIASCNYANLPHPSSLPLPSGYSRLKAFNVEVGLQFAHSMKTHAIHYYNVMNNFLPCTLHTEEHILIYLFFISLFYVTVYGIPFNRLFVW